MTKDQPNYFELRARIKSREKSVKERLSKVFTEEDKIKQKMNLERTPIRSDE